MMLILGIFPPQLPDMNRQKVYYDLLLETFSDMF